MKLGVEILNPLDYRGWDDLVADHPAASVFQTSAWARVLVDSYGYRPVYFCIKDNGSLFALLPVIEVDSFLTGRRGVSLPFTDYANPFAANEDLNRSLSDFSLAYGKKAGWKTLEVRGGESPWKDKAMSSAYFGHRLLLTKTEKEIHTGFSANLRRNIARSMKEELKVDVSNSSEAMEEYYRLHCITRKGHGIPPQPRIFFRNIQEYLLRQNMGFISLATHKGIAVAGAVFLHFGKKAIYKFGASNQVGKQLRANNLLMWEAIRWYRDKSFEELCFGRTDLGDKGLRDYKLGYGTAEFDIPYYKYDIVKDHVVAKDESKGTIKFEKFYTHVPIQVSRIIGSLIYRHIG